MRRLASVLALVIVHASLVGADPLVSPVRARAVRRSAPISIDGRLDEPAWAAAPQHGGFVQRFPRDSGSPAFPTRFAVLYDDEAIYVGVWADDPDPAQIRALLTRRDVDSPSDAVAIEIDSYHDRRTAYAFQLNAAGVQRDMLLFDDASLDDTWDAVWTGDVAITATGWTAEYRIPLSQLRFASRDVQEWGFQLLRRIGRTGEQDAWSPWPRSAPQIVSKFGVLDGIDHLQAGRRLELLPYATAGLERAPVEDGDPLNDTYRARRNIGLDLKYGIGSAFTLSATINPDFGQVEADPSKINLSGSELFFAEKRPFFLEGNELFKLPIGTADNSVEGVFYSRRIGAAPEAPGASYDFIAAPDSTAIYGAAKLTGKTAGWSVGVLDAVTGPETAEIADATGRREVDVAALSNYAIARVKRDLGDGRTSIGGSATAVDRDLRGSVLADSLHDQAYTGGLQLQHRWGDNAWTADASLLGSYVHGSKAAIAATQQGAVHYFQRPDASNVHVDLERTSLSGLGARWIVGRLGDTVHWRFGSGGDLRTPGLELNDAGFQYNSNRLIPYLLAQYREDAPSEHLLNYRITSTVYSVETLEPRVADYGWETNGNIQFSNYWSIYGDLNLDVGRWTINALRGGRTLRTDTSIVGFATVNTDVRAPVQLTINLSSSHTPASGQLDGGVDVGATIQVRSNLDVFAGPSLYLRRDPLQYIDQIPDGSGTTHYVFGRIHETDVSLTLRVNWTFSPHLTLQAYAQPYIAAGHYDQLKDVDNPGADRYAERFHIFTPDELELAGGTYHVVRDGAAYSFDRPDLNFRQLRSTVVLRWEYRPGSTVFAIWSHGRTSDALDDGRFRLGRDLSDLATVASDNLVMVKVNYWFGL
ncbi:MAG TPA: DUF5916 domain-containing protein [Kofleriaceae bacterium]|nr:DUF5916 domain-containing protein [Kofleriaceae bacterium]